MSKNMKLALKLGIQTYQILTNYDEVCIPRLSSILLAVPTYIAFNPEFSIVFSSNFRLFLLTIFALNWCVTVTERISFCSGSFRVSRFFFLS